MKVIESLGGQSGIGALAVGVYNRVHRFAGVLMVLALLVGWLALTEPVFFTTANGNNILRSNTVLMLVALGMTFVILSGGIDLSVGSILAAGAVVLERCLFVGANPGLSIAIAIGAAALLGLVNGLLIGWVGLSFIVVTLGAMSIWRGVVYVTTDGETRYLSNGSLVNKIGDGYIGSVSIPVLLTVVLTIVCLVVLHRTRFGRAVYATGGNPEAARLAGINTVGVIVMVYVVCGIFAGLAGVVQAGRLDAATPVAGVSLELAAIAAVLLGGTSFTGGVGGVGGTVVGVIFVGVLQNGLGLLGIASFWQNIVTGVVLILAVAFDKLAGARR